MPQGSGHSTGPPPPYSESPNYNAPAPARPTQLPRRQGSRREYHKYTSHVRVSESSSVHTVFTGIPNESTPLCSHSQRGSSGVSAKTLITFILLVFVVFPNVFVITMIVQKSLDVGGRHNGHQPEHGEWDREQREKEAARQRKERERLNIHWDEPIGEHGCTSFATREYTARLWNIPFFWSWQKTCEQTEIRIHNVTLKKPDFCENRGIWDGIYGHWRVDFGELDCMPHWGKFSDQSCTAWGSGMHRVVSRLWNIKHGDWVKMCATTPANIYDMHFTSPTYCDDRGILGIYGIWDFEDPECL